ncbi:MAG: 2TM domain-containing protein [Betaproteobacteria bacterium]|nr:2TM domain-containing protein [Betaproteobacteria bacterium]
MDDELQLPGMGERELAIRRRVHRLAEFYRHLVSFVLAIGLMWIANAFMLMNAGMLSHFSISNGAIVFSEASAKLRWFSWWAIWPTLGWGIGIIIHGITVLPFWHFFSQEWEDRKVRELMERDRT